MEYILVYWFFTTLVSSLALLLCFVRTSISNETILAYAARMSTDDMDDVILDLRTRYGDSLGLKISALSFDIFQKQLESNYEDDNRDNHVSYIEDHPLMRKYRIGKAFKPIYQLLINLWTKERLETVSQKVFYALNGQYPHHASLDKRGRVPIHLAVDVISQELGYEYADDMIEALSEVIR